MYSLRADHIGQLSAFMPWTIVAMATVCTHFYYIMTWPIMTSQRAAYARRHVCGQIPSYRVTSHNFWWQRRQWQQPTVMIIYINCRGYYRTISRIWLLHRQMVCVLDVVKHAINRWLPCPNRKPRISNGSGRGLDCGSLPLFTCNHYARFTLAATSRLRAALANTINGMAGMW